MTQNYPQGPHEIMIKRSQMCHIWKIIDFILGGFKIHEYLCWQVKLSETWNLAFLLAAPSVSRGTLAAGLNQVSELSQLSSFFPLLWLVHSGKSCLFIGSHWWAERQIFARALCYKETWRAVLICSHVDVVVKIIIVSGKLFNFSELNKHSSICFTLLYQDSRVKLDLSLWNRYLGGVAHPCGR